MKLFFLGSRPLRDTICSFDFEPHGSFDYLPGQYVEFSLPHKTPDKRGQRRWFTLSSSPSERLLTITTREGKSSFKQALFRLKPGVQLECSEPLGDFVLPKDSGVPLLFYARGMGITPVRSMVQWLTDNHETRTLTVVYSVREHDDAIFLDVMRRYPLQLKLTTEQFKPEEILAHFSQRPEQLLYLSGPEIMTESLHASLLKMGLSRSSVVLDGFPGYTI